MMARSLRIILAIVIGLWCLFLGLSIEKGIQGEAIMRARVINAELDSRLIKLLMLRLKNNNPV